MSSICWRREDNPCRSSNYRQVEVPIFLSCDSPKKFQLQLTSTNHSPLRKGTVPLPPRPEPEERPSLSKSTQLSKSKQDDIRPLQQFPVSVELAASVSTSLWYLPTAKFVGRTHILVSSNRLSQSSRGRAVLGVAAYKAQVKKTASGLATSL